MCTVLSRDEANLAEKHCLDGSVGNPCAAQSYKVNVGADLQRVSEDLLLILEHKRIVKVAMSMSE